MNYYYRKHRATGNPVGRPRIIPRQMTKLHRLGRLETVYIPYAPNPKLVDAYYRLL